MFFANFVFYRLIKLYVFLHIKENLLRKLGAFHNYFATGTYENWQPPFKSKKHVRPTYNFEKGKMAERVDIPW